MNEPSPARARFVLPEEALTPEQRDFRSKLSEAAAAYSRAWWVQVEAQAQAAIQAGLPLAHLADNLALVKGADGYYLVWLPHDWTGARLAVWVEDTGRFLRAVETDGLTGDGDGI